MMPISELRLVRKALRNLFPATAFPRTGCPQRATGIVRTKDNAAHLHHSRIAPAPATKGFGLSPTGAPQPPKKTFEKEDEEESGFAARPEYQIYSDTEFKPKRIVNDVSISDLDGGRWGLVASADVTTGDLLMLLPALSFLEGSFQEAPEPEDLQMAMLENGLHAPLRKVLDAMYIPDEAVTQATKDASFITLDPKFWTSRGNKDASAPTVDASRLLHIIQSCCCTDAQQDTAVMQVRQQLPAGFIGLWPEFPLLSHSCVPNTSITVIGDRMLVHVARDVKKGEALTRNCIGSIVTTPLEERRKMVLEQRGHRCMCPRCVTEERASEEVRDALVDAHNWYVNDGLPQWNACQEDEDMEALKSLQSEAEQLISEVEDALRSDESLSDEERMILRAAAYDSYDLMVMCDEFIHQENSHPSLLRVCLELIRIFAPGSESHTSVAAKYDTIMKSRAELAEYRAGQQLKDKKGGGRKGRPRLGRPGGSGGGSGALVAVRQARELREAADESAELYLEAFFCRYGVLNVQQLDALREGMDMYIEALEQMSIMKAEGKTEESQDYIIDGIKFSLVDKLGGTAGGGMGSLGFREEGDEEGYELISKDGVKLMMMDTPGLPADVLVPHDVDLSERVKNGDMFEYGLSDDVLGDEK
ncbi:hypothetical protein CEUSTIGMA_g2436.t1 [Chlamydomonas eustigma]|uniref:SET domain-containing protein n=1 Tax=Chlamydomonas eustigma TaxID=1157962 RepID=A0A250WWU4_9CHLO|nr:hypothetical protein CEUSTIGMA_g2436.t1 [Chlamydomonas eustigma]|eukprot:GAX74990.1 hypothetical protein CEUSTIGMA_g2436.t1 [Chlamydomonas eustigma]